MLAIISASALRTSPTSTLSWLDCVMTIRRPCGLVDRTLRESGVWSGTATCRSVTRCSAQVKSCRVRSARSRMRQVRRRQPEHSYAMAALSGCQKRRISWRSALRRRPTCIPRWRCHAQQGARLFAL
jgi:hypothetical protein